jgi:5'-nucleotidase
VEVVILSRNDPVSGMRVFRSAQHYGLPIQRGVFTRGQPPWRYLRRWRPTCSCPPNEADVRSALDAGVPAARSTRSRRTRLGDAHPDEVRIAFDGDAVLFSDEAERVFQREGLSAFQSHEREPRRHAAGGRARSSRCCRRCTGCSASPPGRRMRIRTALVTARSAPAHERAIRTLMDWNIEVDEAMFLGGLPKGEFLREFEPDFFFDDQTGHIESAAGMCRPGTWPRVGRQLPRPPPRPARAQAAQPQQRRRAPARARRREAVAACERSSSSRSAASTRPLVLRREDRRHAEARVLLDGVPADARPTLVAQPSRSRMRSHSREPGRPNR